jgi:hypothetical protein
MEKGTLFLAAASYDYTAPAQFGGKRRAFETQQAGGCLLIATGQLQSFVDHSAFKLTDQSIKVDAIFPDLGNNRGFNQAAAPAGDILGERWDVY